MDNLYSILALIWTSCIQSDKIDFSSFEISRSCPYKGTFQLTNAQRLMALLCI
jgi:hypothetical protein